MPRKYNSTERFLKPDPKYGSKVIAKFINCLMKGGKKATARNVVYEALDIIEKKVTPSGLGSMALCFLAGNPILMGCPI